MVSEWYGANDVYYVPVGCMPPSTPHLRPIEAFWTLVKHKLRKSQKVASSAKSFQKYWIGAANKLDQALVKRLMAGLASKVNKFSRSDVNA